MKRMQRAVALLLFLLLFLPSVTMAAGDPGDVPSKEETETVVETADRAGEDVPAQTKIVGDEKLCQRIRDTYKAAKKRSRRSSFKGYCGAYVANQLVVLGINTSYLSANGKNTYDIYRKMDRTSGGYDVCAYSAKEYSLSEALRTIMKKDPAASNILVGFQRGTSASGKKYGHVLFIHGIRDGMIYYSDSSARTIDDVKYKEGEPIVCSLSSFTDQYAKYKLDGVVHFRKEEELQSSITAETTSTNEEKASILG